MSYSEKIYNMVSNYTSSSQTDITNTNMKTAADDYFDILKDSHDDGDLTSSNYNYYGNISLVLDAVSGLSIFPTELRTKIKSAGSRFVFKNKVDDKYIIVNDQKAFVFTDEGDFDDIVTAYDWAQANNVYSSTQVTAQYNGALQTVASNPPTQ